ncbi:MAG: DUF1559 domain-containing protein [Planctomycetes bacterium]|nr:DUF1559 domain-containing protein [Planctomycetota bacterium]
MKARDRLLGYLLGALDAGEHAEVERALAESPELRDALDALRIHLAPLDQARGEHEPPSGLVERTCERVEWEEARRADPTGTPGPPEVPVAPATRWAFAWDRLAPGRRATLADSLVGIGVCLAVAILFFPALLSSREAARRTICEDHLRRLATALHLYAEQYGTAPYIPPIGNRAIAANVPLTLRELELLGSSEDLLCPGAEPRHLDEDLPKADDLDRATGILLGYLQRIAGGHYAYTLGVRDGERYGPASFEARAWFAVASDGPSPRLRGRMSDHHGGRGLNVLFEDGHIAFLRNCRLAATGDDVFHSAAGFVECGLSKHDSSLGPSHAHPLTAPLLQTSALPAANLLPVGGLGRPSRPIDSSPLGIDPR